MPLHLSMPLSLYYTILYQHYTILYITIHIAVYTTVQVYIELNIVIVYTTIELGGGRKEGRGEEGR